MSRKVVDQFLRLVQIDSESLHEREIISYLKDELERIGFDVEIDEADKYTKGESGNLIGWLEGAKEIEPLLLCAHADTVKPGIGVIPVLEDNRIHSRGNTVLGADDKSGIAMILAGIEEYLESGERHAPVELFFTVSEEIGLLGAKGADYGRLRSRCGYVLDGNLLGEVVKASPSQIIWQGKFTGKRAHAGIEPEKGKNAIKAAARAIMALPDGRIDQETTMNIGIIRGGEATNVVCDEVDIRGEIRSHNEQKLEELSSEVNRILSQTATETGCELEFSIDKSFSAVKIDENSNLMKLSARAFEMTGIEQISVINGGGSDANVFQQKGLETIVVGTGMQKIHSTDEFIEISDLEAGKEWVKNIIGIWSKK